MNVTLARESKHWPSPGGWLLLRLSNKTTARVACADCGKMASLSDHEIDADGKVTPSIVCPDFCGWHVFATLEGWPEAIASV